MRSVFFALLLCNFIAVSAQTLVTIDNEEISVSEFKRMYEKNLQDKSSAYQANSVNEYFDLFVDYKLKLKEAEVQQLAEQPKVKDEIELYEEQLIKSTFDKAIMNDLLEEAYERSKEEICVSHILINVRNNPSPEDTLLAYNDALEIRNMLLQGADFASLAQRKSRDVDSKFDGGSLGCFSTLQVSEYRFENAVYSLQKGEISMPKRTSWGYHIIKCDDRRPANGAVRAAQVFVRANSFQKDEVNAAARENIYEAYNELRNGADFEDVVAEFSEDEATNGRGGDLGAFTVGTYEADFENAIFDLKEIGDYSKPVKTRVGWHIFKLLEREEAPAFEEVEMDLREQIINDERYELAQQAYGETLKKKYGYEADEENIKLFRKEAAPGITIRGWQVPSSYPLSNEFFKLGEESYSAAQFVNYVRRQHARGRFLSFTRFLENFESEQLLQYHRVHITESDEDLKQLLQEYKDGIIIFNLMEKEVWGQTKPSDTALKAFFERNQAEYLQEAQIKNHVYIAPDKKTAGKVKKYLKKGASGGLGIKALAPKMPSNVAVSTTSLPISQATINGIDLSRMGAVATEYTEEGVKIYKSYEFVEGKKEEFAAIKGRVLADYQRDVEGNWLEGLRNKFSVEVDKEVLEQLYK
ncbi:MAG: peptidylprolyl isomerase [Saprospiraceae bacterium]|nr:peptidylprolyl isomerase [Saprospiraceae bacterium]